MIFISKKAFNEEMDRRMSEIHFKNRIDEKIWELDQKIRNLEHKVDCLEERNRIPVMKKYDYTEENCCEVTTNANP